MDLAYESLAGEAASQHQGIQEGGAAAAPSCCGAGWTGFRRLVDVDDQAKVDKIRDSASRAAHDNLLNGIMKKK